MDIVIINGSPRKKGATAEILHKIEEELQYNAEVKIAFINIADLNIAPCNGCCSCYRMGYCYMQDDAEKLSRQICEADGVIIGSPTYASNISGQLKQFIDRGHFVVEQLLAGKYAMSVVTGENYGSRDADKILTKLLKYSGAKLSGHIVCNLPFNQKISASHISKKIEKLSGRFYGDISKKRKYYFQASIHQFIFRIGIKPFVLKKGEAYQGVLRKWEKQGGAKHAKY